MFRNKGFTAIELIVALAIVLLLVAVAVASFQDHMQRKVRMQAVKALVENADWLRQQHAQSGTYLVKLPQTQIPFEGAARYQLSLVGIPFSASDPKAVFPATSNAGFTLQAVPTSADACGILLLDSSGRTGVTGVEAEVDGCWR